MPVVIINIHSQEIFEIFAERMSLVLEDVAGPLSSYHLDPGSVGGEGGSLLNITSHSQDCRPVEVLQQQIRSEVDKVR